jgi:hypothetical protein
MANESDGSGSGVRSLEPVEKLIFPDRIWGQVFKIGSGVRSLMLIFYMSLVDQSAHSRIMKS